MGASRTPVASTGSRLFLIYAIASLVPVLLLGLALSHGYRHEASTARSRRDARRPR